MRSQIMQDNNVNIATTIYPNPFQVKTEKIMNIIDATNPRMARFLSISFTILFLISFKVSHTKNHLDVIDYRFLGN